MDNTKRTEAIRVLEREFGPGWRQLVQELGTEDLRRRVGKELPSFMAFPERGQGGDNRWRGNCSPEVIRALLSYALECKHYRGNKTKDFTLLDPMSGSGTSKAAADSMGVRSVLYDLNPAPAHGLGGWNALRDEVDDSADMIFLHPPYHNMIAYSGAVWGSPHRDDLSRCENYKDFIEKLNFVVKKLFLALLIPFSLRRESSVDLRKTDTPALTWHHLIRMTMEELGGRAKLSDLGDLLSDHPKAKKNPHFRDRIRATVYEHPGQYISCGNGIYSLSYAAA